MDISKDTSKPADAIHIYTDGCWLTPGTKHNPVAAGGLGVVIVRPGEKAEFLNDPPGDGARQGNIEYMAVLYALRTLAKKLPPEGSAPVFLHTDQLNLINFLNAHQQAIDSGTAEKIFIDIATLLDQTHTYLVYEPSPKEKATGNNEHTARMQDAHNLASQAAHAVRYRLQGYLEQSGTEKKLTGSDAERFISRLTRNLSAARTASR